MIEPDYYQNKNGRDLIDAYADQMTSDEFRGFMIGNIIKYLTRYRQKNGMVDLRKAETYMTRLEGYEADQYAD